MLRTDYSLTGCCTCTSRNSQLTWNLAPWPGASIWWHHTSQNHSHPTPFRGKAQAQVSSNIDVYVYLKIIIIVLYASTGSSLLPNSMRSKWANFPHTKSNTPDQGATLAVLCELRRITPTNVIPYRSFPLISHLKDFSIISILNFLLFDFHRRESEWVGDVVIIIIDRSYLLGL